MLDQIALKNLEGTFLEYFDDSPFAQQLSDLFQQINKCVSDMTDIEYFYREELYDYVCLIEEDEITEFIERWNGLQQHLDVLPITNSISGIKDILDWIEEKAADVDYSEVKAVLPEHIVFGYDYIIYGPEKQQYDMVMDELDSNKLNGDPEWLGIEIYKDGEERAAGSIEIIYGLDDLNCDGSTEDDCDLSINYQTDDVIDFVKDIAGAFGEYVDSEMEMVRGIRDGLEL